MCEYVHDSRPWGGHSKRSRAGARHCDINIPSLSAVNQRGIRRSLTLLTNLCSGFRVTRHIGDRPEGNSLLLSRLLVYPTAFVLYTHVYIEEIKLYEG